LRRAPRTCPDRSASQALEALGVELMEKAAEVEQAIAIPCPRFADEQ
jgi:hypothetical protein